MGKKAMILYKHSNKKDNIRDLEKNPQRVVSKLQGERERWQKTWNKQLHCFMTGKKGRYWKKSMLESLVTKQVFEIFSSVARTEEEIGNP